MCKLVSILLADTDSLSQVSSTGSSGVEEEEEDPGVLLRHHFDTLADSLAANGEVQLPLAVLCGGCFSCVSITILQLFSLPCFLQRSLIQTSGNYSSPQRVSS